jgi:hypothetical protein
VLIRIDDEGALAIGQLSHSWLAGQLARAWGNSRFGGVEPREEVVLGAEQHDIGWALFDLAPRLSPATGLPRSFLELTPEEHVGIWLEAPDHLLSQSLHAALVVSLHGRSLSELRARSMPEQAGMLQPHIDRERERQVSLAARLGLSDADMERVRRQMWTWDSLSLALCHVWRPFTARDVPTSDGLTDLELRDRDDGTCTLEPWPFTSDRVEVRCEARRLARSYEDEATMLCAFERAEPVTLAFRLAAPQA